MSKIIVNAPNVVQLLKLLQCKKVVVKFGHQTVFNNLKNLGKHSGKSNQLPSSACDCKDHYRVLFLAKVNWIVKHLLSLLLSIEIGLEAVIYPVIRPCSEHLSSLR